MMKFLSLFITLSLVLQAYDDFNIAKKWLIKEVYNTPELMYDFYCNKPFGKVIRNGKETLVPLGHKPFKPFTKAGDSNIRAERIEWEHIVPAEQFGKQLKECRNAMGVFIGRKACGRISPKFRKMLADPMNLVPAIGEVNADRSNFKPTGEKIPHNSKYKRCGIHIDKDGKKIHIPDRLKGQVGRTYLHMHKEYGMELSKQDMKMFQAWNRQFPETLSEKALKAKKMASVKKYERKKQQRVASTNRRASASVMTKKTKPSKLSIRKEPATVKPKLSKVSSSAAKSAAKRGMVKGTAAGIGQYIPYVGIAAQIAWDAYLGYKIEMHDVQIVNNEQNIQLNRKYIENVEKRVEQEQKILHTNISVNSANIVLNMQKIVENSEQFAALDEGLSTVIWQLSSVQLLVEQNKQDIQAFKDGIFKTGVQKLNEYYETNKTNLQYLNDAIHDFDTTKNIENPSVEALADYYLVIARYENYLAGYSNYEFGEMKRNYKELADIVLNDSSNIALLNSAYISISDRESSKLTFFIDTLQTLTDEIVERKIKNAKFDEALDIAQNYITVVSKHNTDFIYQKALTAKQENYSKFKNFTSVSNALKIVKVNQNSLLNEEAIRFLAKERSMQNALELLRTKRLDSKDFRMKGFVCIYNYLNEKEKVRMIQKMVRENPTYSDILKKDVLSLSCKKKN